MSRTHKVGFVEFVEINRFEVLFVMKKFAKMN